MMSTLSGLAFGVHAQLLRQRCAVALYLAILLFGAVPGARAEIGAFAPGIVLHAAAYSTITFLLYSGRGQATLLLASRIFLIVAAMGAGDELIQARLPYRTGAVLDWVVDITASFITLVVMTAGRSVCGNDGRAENGGQ